VAITVRYNPFIGGFLLICGLFIMLVGLTIAAPTSLLLGLMNTVLGLAFMIRPWFVYTGEAIEMRNVLGMTMKTYKVPNVALLTVDSGAAHYDGKKLFGFGSLASPTDWAAFREAAQPDS
jgi:hypothetical protein